MDIAAPGRTRALTDAPISNGEIARTDALAVTGSLVLALYLYRQPFNGYYFALLALAFFVTELVFGEVKRCAGSRYSRFGAEVGDILAGWLAVVAILLFAGYAAKLSAEFSRRVLLTWFVTAPAVIFLLRKLARGVASGVAARAEPQRVVIVGANELGLALADRICSGLCPGVRLQGFFDERSGERLALPAAHSLLGGFAALHEYVNEHRIETIYIALPMTSQPRILHLLERLHDTTASIYFVPDIFIFDLMQARLHAVHDIPVIAVCETPIVGVDRFTKRLSDVALASLSLLLVAPLMLLIAAGIKASSPGPVLFRQRRYGLAGEQFFVYKFRTMVVCEDGPTVAQAAAKDTRVTRFGAWLRRTSLDELPQLMNVLRGDMSVVGPRPHAVAHNEMYRKLIKGYMLRHKVKPGITGWAQVNGLRGETQTVDLMEARVNYDLEYLRNWSLWFDIRILVRTVRVVLNATNAY